MAPSWKNVTQSVPNDGVLKKTAPEVEAAAASWLAEERDLCLHMSSHVGREVTAKVERKLADDPAARLKASVEDLIADHALYSVVRVPNCASDIDICVDLARRTVAVSMSLKAPADKKSTKARVNWLLRMLPDDDDRLLLRAHWPGRGAPTMKDVKSLRDDPAAIQNDNPDTTPHSFEVLLVENLGKRFSGRRTFIEDVERILPSWLSDAVALRGRIGTPATTAQVHPARFTEGLMRAAEAVGARLVEGEMTDVVPDGSESVGGIMVDREQIAADRVILAMGPWSIRAGGWIDLPTVYAIKEHSLVFDAPEIPAEALFLEHQDADGRTASPEIFPRKDGTVYACAISSEAPLPDDPTDTDSDAGAIERLEAMCHAISPALSPDRVLARQACHRPVARDGLPLIGPVRGAEGVFFWATGHGPWGILNAPATGEAVAELILDGAARTVDLSPFDPARLPPLRRVGSRRGTATVSRTPGRHGETRERR